MNAVGGIDLQTRTAVFFDDFIYTGRTIARFGRGVFFVVYVYHDLRIFQYQMVGLIFFVRKVGKENAAQTVEGQNAVGLRIINRLAFGGFFELLVVFAVMFQSPWGFASENHLVDAGID